MDIIYKNISEVVITDTANKNLENCKIYIPSNLNIDILNLYINDVLIETQKNQTRSNGYSIYTISPTKILKMSEGEYTVYVEGINIENLTKNIFIKTRTSFSFDEYNALALKYFSQCIGDEVSIKYEKIIKIANLCIDIYNSMKVNANE